MSDTKQTSLMSRSSSRKDLRAERRGVTPYTRPALKQTTSWNPITRLRDFASSVLGTNDDDRSVSGSEEEWNGRVPDVMRGEDLFSLAAAAGRGGPDFEERAQTWRQGKASLRGKPASKSNWGALGLGHLDLDVDADRDETLRSSPSMPQLRQETPKMLAGPPRDSELRRERELRPSGSTLALRRFMEDKGVRFDPEDAEVLEGLARSLRAETAEKEGSRPQHFGGWSAGTPTKYTPQPLRQSLRESLKSSEAPAPAPAPSTPGSVFSLGSNAPLPGRTTTHRKITYLGPGMSMRRLNRAPKPARKPLFDNLEFAKKRKVDDAIEVDEAPPTPEVAAAASVAAAFNAKRKSTGFPSRPQPATPEPARRPPSPTKPGDDVLRDLIEETLGPETSKPSLVINPYEELAPAPSGKVPALRSSLRKSSNSLKVSMRGSASRGAAEKLANVGTSTRKMTTLEMVSGYKSTRESSAAASASASRSPEPIVNPGSALKESTSVAPSPPAAPKSSFKPPEPASFSPLPVPSLSSSTSAFKSTPKPVMSEPAPSKVAEITASKASPAPVFNPPVQSSVGLGPPPVLSASALPSARASASRRFDPSAIYLSAKDSALAVDKAALPFFTFTLPPGMPQPSDAVKEMVKEAVASSKVPTFSFTIRKPSLPSSFLAPTATAADKGKPAEWTCDTCMLKNPDSAKDKCTICEAPRPGSAPSKPAAPAALPTPPTGGFTFKPAAKPAGQWTCDTCMLQNPDSAKDKCTVCETPRPGAAPKAAAPPAAPPAPPAGGFSFGGKPAASSSGFTIPKPAATPGEWTCDTCMLKNPSTATEKCTVCETPKPGAAPKAAAPPAALPTPPAGGFAFGGKPAAQSTPGLFGAKPRPTDQWTCDTCMLQNPSTATEKCTICEAPKPGAAPKAAAPPASLPAPPAGGFTFGGKPAGPPAPPSGGFTFGKPATGPPAPPSGGFSFGAPASGGSAGGFSFGSSSASGSGSGSSSSAPTVPGLPAPPAGGFTFGKPSAPAAAPLLKPTGGAGEWTCTTCGLKNPASATEQCTICETPK